MIHSPPSHFQFVFTPAVSVQTPRYRSLLLLVYFVRKAAWHGWTECVSKLVLKREQNRNWGSLILYLLITIKARCCFFQIKMASLISRNVSRILPRLVRVAGRNHRGSSSLGVSGRIGLCQCLTSTIISSPRQLSTQVTKIIMVVEC